MLQQVVLLVIAGLWSVDDDNDDDDCDLAEGLASDYVTQAETE
jgi:hypothetical protein